MDIFFKTFKSLKTFALGVQVEVEDTINSYKKLYCKKNISSVRASGQYKLIGCGFCETCRESPSFEVTLSFLRLFHFLYILFCPIYVKLKLKHILLEKPFPFRPGIS